MSARAISFRAKFARMYLYGRSVPEIAAAHSVSIQTVRDLLARSGFPDAPERYAAPLSEPQAPERHRVRIMPAPQVRRAAPVVGATTSKERVWCEQCQRNQLMTAVEACAWRFCKAKAVAA